MGLTVRRQDFEIFEHDIRYPRQINRRISLERQHFRISHQDNNPDDYASIAASAWKVLKISERSLTTGTKRQIKALYML